MKYVKMKEKTEKNEGKEMKMKYVKMNEKQERMNKREKK